MKRVTVAITLADNYMSSYSLKKIKSAMINAAVLKATELDVEIAALEGRVGHVRARL